MIKIINILPQPVDCSHEDGEFILDSRVQIVLGPGCSEKALHSAKLIQEEIINIIGLKPVITKSFSRPRVGHIHLSRKNGEQESYELKINSDLIMIAGADQAGLFYGAQTLIQVIRGQGTVLPGLVINDRPYFENRGYYHDVTRGKVPTLETLKELVERISFYKINQLQLYIEHTFAFEKYSEIWAGSDPLTAGEILQLDEYCRKFNVDLVPSLATFGHLYQALRTDTLSHLAELEEPNEGSFSWIERMRHHTLDVSNPESLQFVRNMLKEFIPLFSSNKFNICGDETFDLGSGKNKELAEEKGKGRLYAGFLNKIIAEVKKYDKEVMFWGDIILDYPELLDELPEDLICLNWYYGEEPCEENFRAMAGSGIPQYVCPGVSGWNRLMNDMDTAFQNITRMVGYGKKYDAAGVLNTDWGDYGHINLFASSMPGMIYGANLAWNPDTIKGNNYHEQEFEKIDARISQLEFGDNTGRIVGVLRELAREQIVNWGDIVLWKEKKYEETSLEFDVKGMFEKVSEKDLLKGYERARELAQKILNLAVQAAEDRKSDFEEFYVSARGIALFDLLALYIKKFDYGQGQSSVDITPEEL
ncbi:MAG: glycoside hydrolase family 20 zincin-like fold domain-containing protein, partial [Halanaerobiaceae bacterium]